MAAAMEEDVTAKCGLKRSTRSCAHGDPPWSWGWVGSPGRAAGTGRAAADAREAMSLGSCRWRPTSCSPPPRCWVGWRWNGCSLDCRPATVLSDSNRSQRASSRPPSLRGIIAAAETALAELLAADVAGLDVVALLVDWVHFGEHCCVVAVGVDIDGVEQPLSLVEGST